MTFCYCSWPCEIKLRNICRHEYIYIYADIIENNKEKMQYCLLPATKTVSICQEKFKMFKMRFFSMNHLRSNFLPVLENWPIKSAAERSTTRLGHCVTPDAACFENDYWYLSTNGLNRLRQSARTYTMLWLGGVPVLSKENPEVRDFSEWGKNWKQIWWITDQLYEV